MTPLIVGTGFVTFVLSYLGVGGFRRWAERRQILDLPTGRSSHELPTARGGGLVIVVVSLLGIWVLAWLQGQFSNWHALLAYTLGSVLIANVSWLDDLRPLPVALRFSAHAIGAIAVILAVGYWSDVHVPGIGSFHLGVGGALLTFLWIVGLTNAYNFMDGIDGIAAGQAVVAGAGWTLIGWQTGQPLTAALGMVIGACSLGFLGHNWPPARIFMGDVGSAYLGFTLAVLPLLWAFQTKGQATGSALLVGTLLLWPFVFDTIFTFSRRLLKGEKVFEAHRSHLYQRLVLSGLSHRAVTLLYILLAAIGLVLTEVWAPEGLSGAVRGFVLVPLLCFGLLVFVNERERLVASLRPAIWTHFLRYRLLAIFLSQTILLTLTYFFSFFLRLDLSLNEPYLSVFLQTLPVVLIVKLAVFSYFRLFRGWWRYVGLSDLLDIIKAAAVSTPIIYAVVHLTHGFTYYPRSVFIIDPILTVFVIGGTRFAVRINTEHTRRYIAHSATIIVGAGQAGSTIARELKTNQRLDYAPIGFVDDDPTKKGVRIQGIKVLGSTGELPGIITENEVAHVLIAIPSATGRQIQRIMDICRKCSVDFKTLPALGDIINGTASLGQVRNVRVEDLLTRKPVRLDLGRIRSKFQGKSVLITGAGGSIGSELSRQIAGFGPGRLVLYERAESDLHQVTLDLKESFPELNVTPVIGDILDVNRLREVMADYRPNSVFHAAAYKHVPMMEQNCFQAVTNNVFGTYNVALTARQSGVEDLVLISSDKAVNPSNVMGVTKRVAELLLLGLQHQSTRYVSVRFGNVLGSKGSVVPMFEQQIAARKPVTVTDPEAKRYFMTVSEAVQLVLQASTMGNGGEIFVLDMGEPIKVVDLARDLIRLSGLEPETDIQIVYTGLRPGEKLFEELKLDGEGIKPTSHEKIRVLDGGEVGFDQMRGWLDSLAALVAAKNMHGLLSKLREIVPEYTPSKETLALAEIDRYGGLLAYDHSNMDPAGR